ncbi:MAG TPA: toll/interleukin-1 receptor domain-containing protein [Rhizomicrobium sp.]|nr:toll/interleukin-1 receptor domain-containing protein [Rhizomicrobium sp.]
MPFVFVSHAGPDKPRLKPLVEALMDAGLKLWIDNPAALGLAPERLREFYRIRAGARWQDEIDEALRQSACVLVCWSKEACDPRIASGKKRVAWLDEAAIGRGLGKLVACTIDDVDPKGLPGTHSSRQVPRVDSDLPRQRYLNALDLLIEDVKQMVARNMESRRSFSMPRDCFAPFFADRTEQTMSAREAIAEVAQKSGVSPMLIVGPENERPDEFRRRIGIESAQLLSDGGRWWEMETPWPSGVPPRQFAASYRRALSCALRLSGQIDDHRIAAALEAKARPVAVFHCIRAEEWGSEEPERIREWLRCWRDFIAAVPGLRVIPWLQVKLPPVKPGWRECPPGLSRLVWDAILSMRRKLDDEGAAPAVAVPPILPPIMLGDADRWIDQLQPDAGPRRRRLEEEVARLYRSRSFFQGLVSGQPRKHGVDHHRFAVALEPLFAEP